MTVMVKDQGTPVRSSVTTASLNKHCKNALLLLIRAGYLETQH
jgi:hypothetical protein